jgi:pyruvate dehydrogenase kinase 2/3/4
MKHSAIFFMDSSTSSTFLHAFHLFYVVDQYLRISATAIPNLSLGLSLSSRHLDPEHLDSFLRRMLVSRLSRRVLVEHHIALSDIMAGRIRHEDAETEGGRVGIIWTALNVKNCMDKCIRWLKERPVDLGDDSWNTQGMPLPDQWPEIVIDGHLNTRFSYIREHLEYDLSMHKGAVD